MSSCAGGSKHTSAERLTETCPGVLAICLSETGGKVTVFHRGKAVLQTGPLYRQGSSDVSTIAVEVQTLQREVERMSQALGQLMPAAGDRAPGCSLVQQLRQELEHLQQVQRMFAAGDTVLCRPQEFGYLRRGSCRRGCEALCSCPGCGKPTWDGLSSGAWCSTGHRSLSSKSMEESNFEKHYKLQKALTSEVEVWERMEVVLRYVLAHNKKDAMEASAFIGQLKEAVAQMTRSEKARGQDPAVLISILSWKCGAVDRWNREWCSYLQEAVRVDADECMGAVAQLWRTMNQHVVTRQQQSSRLRVPWPADNTLHRGGRLPHTHVAWLEGAVRNGTISRNRTATATTKTRNKAFEFMQNWGYPTDEPGCYQVHWKFHLDADEKCVHVNFIEDWTLESAEQEFLFPPYSAFRPTRIEWKGDHYVVDVDVMIDNKSDVFDGPVPAFAPLIPWM